MSYIEYVTYNPADDNPIEELARVNRFTMADLDVNRKGKISDKQFNRLLMRAIAPLRYTMGAMLGWLLFCFVVRTLVPGIVLMLISLFGGKSITVVFFAITLSCAAAVVVSLFKAGAKMLLLMQDLSAGKAAFLDGRVSPSREDEAGIGLAKLYGEQHRNAWYVVQDQYFEVEPAACEALQQGMRYRLYHTPKSKLLLSIEPVPAS